MAVEIVEVTDATPAVQEALARLLPQLNPALTVPDLRRVQALMDDPDVTLLFAREGEEVVGTATLIVYTTPFWIKARIDEVVVDAGSRGKSVGEAMVRACLDVARKKGAQIAELQSARIDERASAHRLYLRMGFQIRNSDIFRISLR
ncbi:MAG TPA: GNAT family N-acetyltransferase [Candidatus Dormibacteraeota bacterium]|nr:GNAT family N-acetyltransferase [Candidatus Dormibacteraeota bacterium]